MTDDSVDLRKLAEEAAGTVYDPRAKKCWPWSHRWTMWAVGRHPAYPTIQAVDIRRCLRCGKTQVRDIG